MKVVSGIVIDGVPEMTPVSGSKFNPPENALMSGEMETAVTRDPTVGTIYVMGEFCVKVNGDPGTEIENVGVAATIGRNAERITGVQDAINALMAMLAVIKFIRRWFAKNRLKKFTPSLRAFR